MWLEQEPGKDANASAFVQRVLANGYRQAAVSKLPDVVYNLWVRMWREYDAEQGDRWEWRGRVKNALTQQNKSFRRLEGLLAAIDELTDERAAKPRGEKSSGA